MRFGSNRYVPILRWKAAEKDCLVQLSPSDKAAIVPMFELIPPFVENLNDSYAGRKFALEIGRFWGTPIAFADFTNITALPGMVSGFVAEAKRLNLGVIPTATCTMSTDTLAELKRTRMPICIRLNASDPTTIAERLSALHFDTGTSPTECHLIIDREVWPDNAVSTQALLAPIRHLTEYQSLSVAGSSFPIDLTCFEKPGEYELPRVEWAEWKALQTSTPVRMPSFSDYTIQYGRYRKPPEKCHFSASIRYTAEDNWVIMRGKSVFAEDGAGYAQWPSNAQMLMLRSEFRGREFSAGDTYIVDRATDKKTGTAKLWLQAGIGHHLALAARQVLQHGGSVTLGSLADAKSPSLKPLPIANK